MVDLEHHILSGLRREGGLLVLGTVDQGLAVVGVLEGAQAHNRGVLGGLVAVVGVGLKLLGACRGENLNLKDVAVGAVLTRQEGDVGEIILGAQVKDQVLRHVDRVRVVGVPVASVIVVEDVVHLAVLAGGCGHLAGLADDRDVGLGARVDERGLVDRAHLEGVNCVLNGNGRRGNVIGAVAAGRDEVLTGLDGILEGGVAPLGVGGGSVAAGITYSLLERRGVHALGDGHRVGRRLRPVKRGRNRDGGGTGLVAAHVPNDVSVGVGDGGHACNRGIGTADVHVRVDVVGSDSLGVNARQLARVKLGLVVSQLDTVNSDRRGRVVEVDLAQGQHAVVGGAARSLASARQRGDLDLGDQLAGVGLADLKVVDGLLRVKGEVLGRVALEVDLGLERRDAAVAALAVANLNVVKRGRLPELKRHRCRELDVGRELAGLGVVVALDVPLELELNAVGAIEEAVIAALLDELLDVGAVVAGQLVVRHGDVERVLTILGGLGARSLGELGRGAVGLNDLGVAGGANKPGGGGERDVRVGKGPQLERGHDARTVVEGLVALVHKGEVHGLDIVVEGGRGGRLVLHAREVCASLDAVGNELELAAVIVDDGAQGVDVGRIARVEVDGHDVTGLDRGRARDDGDAAVNGTGLGGAVVDLGHREGHVVHVVHAVVVDVKGLAGNVGLELVRVGRAVLATKGVAEVLDVLGANRIRGARERAHFKARGAVCLVDGNLAGGEEPTNRGERRQAHVAGKGVLGEPHGLDVAVLTPTRGLRNDGPVDTVEARLDLHARDGAVTGVVAGIVLHRVEVVGKAVVDRHGLADVVPVGVESAVAGLQLVVEGLVLSAVAVDATLPVDARGRGNVAPRVLEGGGAQLFAPLGEALGVARTDLIGVRAVVGQVGVVVGRGITNAEDHAVNLELVARGTINGIPGEGDARRGLLVLGSGEVGRRREALVEDVLGQVAIVLKAGDRQRLGGAVDVGLSKLHVELRRRDDLGLGELLALNALVVGVDVGVEVRRRVVEVDGLAGVRGGGVEVLLGLNLGLREDLLAVLGLDGAGLGGHVHHEGGGAVGVVAVVGAVGLAGGEGGGVALDLGGEGGLHVRAVGDVVLDAVLGIGAVGLVLDVGAVVLVQRVVVLAVDGVELHDALGAVRAPRVVLGDGLGVVVRLVHRNDRVGLHEDRELPDGGVEVVEHLTAGVLIAGPVVDPDGARVAREVDVVADVVAIAQAAVGGVAISVLVDGGNEEVLTHRELVLRGRARSVPRVVGEEDGADDRQAEVIVAGPILNVGRGGGGGVDVREKLGLELQVHAVDAGVGIAVGVGHLGIGAPAVHVQHERDEGLPLVVTRGDDVVATEDAVHVRAHVGVAGKALADERGDVEADVLPVAARLVTRPDARKALRACPAVNGDDERALVGLGGHDVVGRLRTVEAEGVAGADPCDVGFEHRDAALLDLSLEVAQRLPRRVGVGVRREVGLSPEARGNAMGVGVVRELLEVLDVGRNGLEARLGARAVGLDAAGHVVAVLAVAGSVAVVRQEVAERHVVILVAVELGLSGVLIREVHALGDVIRVDGGAVAVERLNMLVGAHRGAGAALLVGDGIRLAAKLRMTVDGPAAAIAGLAGVRPGVTVVGVVVTHIEGVVRNKSGVARHRVVLGEEVLCNRGNASLGVIRDKDVGVVLVVVVRSGHNVLAIAKVVGAGGKGVAKDAVALTRPVERVRGGNAAVDPVALVGNVDGVASVDEAAVLHAATEEVLGVALRQSLDRSVTVELNRGGLLHDRLVAIGDGHEGSVLAERNRGVARGDGNRVGAVVDVNRRRRLVNLVVIRLGLDARGVRGAVGGRVRVEVARRVNHIVDDAVLEERHAALNGGAVGVEGD